MQCAKTPFQGLPPSSHVWGGATFVTDENAKDHQGVTLSAFINAGKIYTPANNLSEQLAFEEAMNNEGTVIIPANDIRSYKCNMSTVTTIKMP